MRRHVAVIFIALLLPTAASTMQLSTTHEPSADPVAQLQEHLDRGEATLEYDKKWGYLPSLLKNLHVPISSQTLVFSKTSLQIDHIAPWSPRALYFNDDVLHQRSNLLTICPISWLKPGFLANSAAVT